MYCLLNKFYSNWYFDPINSLDDATLEELIRQMKIFSPHDVFLLHSKDNAITFSELLTSISDTYFNGDLKGALEDFQNYLGVNDLDLIVRLEEIRGLPLADRQAAMDGLIIKIHAASQAFQGAHLVQYKNGNSGPLF